MSTHTITFEVERGEDDDYKVLSLEITGHVSPYVPAKTYGPPENCYPAEGGEAEIGTILLDGKLWDGELTDSERESVEQQLSECEMDGDSRPDPDDYYDDYD